VSGLCDESCDSECREWSEETCGEENVRTRTTIRRMKQGFKEFKLTRTYVDTQSQPEVDVYYRKTLMRCFVLHWQRKNCDKDEK
jgi:hypothetical protein